MIYKIFQNFVLKGVSFIAWWKITKSKKRRKIFNNKISSTEDFGNCGMDFVCKSQKKKSISNLLLVEVSDTYRYTGSSRSPVAK